MATFNKFDQTVEDLAKGIHQLQAAGHTVKAYLSNAAPNGTTHKIKGDIAEIAAGNGYTAGGYDIQNDVSRTGAVLSMTGVSPAAITAAGGAVGAFQYVILYNDSVAVPLKPLLGWWDRGSAVTLADGDSFTITLGASVLTLT